MSRLIGVLRRACSSEHQKAPHRRRIKFVVERIADAVITWNETAAKAATAACIHISGNALAESRLYAMVHVAVYDVSGPRAPLRSGARM